MSKLSKLLSLKVRFLSAENPSPSKITAAFKQNETAFDTLEYVVGNGHDNFTDKRIVVPNLASAVGISSKIYKPVNKIAYLKDAKALMAGESGGVVDPISNNSIPVTGQFKFTFTASANKRYLLVYNNSATMIKKVGGTDSANKWTSYEISANTSTSTSTISLIVDAQSQLTEIALVDEVDYITIPGLDPDSINVFNEAVSMPLGNAVKGLWRVRVPCILAESCSLKTCAYCIGNTYDTNGVPLCTANGVGQPEKYSPDNVAQCMTIQSCLLKYKTMPYQILNAPYKFSLSGTGAVNSKVLDGVLYLYNSTSNSPTRYQQPIYIASLTRRDILLLKSPIEASASNTQFMIVGGNYGIADQIIDLTEIIRPKV
jgi:hypothetical protein